MLNLFCILGGVILSIVTTYFLNCFTLDKIYVPILLIPCFVLLLFLIVVVFLYISSLLLPKKQPPKSNKFCYFIVKIVIGWLCQMARIKVHIRGIELLDKDKRYMLVSNHRSNFDPMIQFKYFKSVRPVMISKPENFKTPIVGPYIKNAGFLAIDRENNREALKTIVRAIDTIKNQKLSIGICPEGTRNKHSRDLLPMKAGAFKIATKSKSPIAVMTFEGTEKIHKNFPFKRTHVYIDILKVYDSSEYDNMSTQQLCDDITMLMQENINKYTQMESNYEKK